MDLYLSLYLLFYIIGASDLVFAASFKQPIPRDLSILRRATPDAPDGYTPKEVDCPSDRPTIRDASGLSPEETSWLPTRRNNTISAMKDLFSRLNVTGFDAEGYINQNANNASALPNIGIAVSGGGYRALTNGAGALAAFDNRTANSTQPGMLGGLLQSATYLAGLSGGGWLVGSLYVNNFTSVQAIQNTTTDISGSLWQFGNSIFEGPATGGIQVLDSAEYYTTLADEIGGKENAGYDITITDYWGRALSFQLVNATDGGVAYTFSSISEDPDFTSGNSPMPILVTDGRAPNQLIVPTNATVYEFNPWELGSFDPTVFGFAPLRYIGSNFTGGSLPDSEQCVRGYDNAGFVMGTSSSLFNEFFLEINSTAGVPQVLKSALSSILGDISSSNEDIASWEPNPFYGFNPHINENANSRQLTLVDGGEDLQNIPLHPLIQPTRKVDVIFAVDSSADTLNSPNWPNGTSLVASYQRTSNATLQNGTLFPSVPDQNTFVNLGLNNRPTFFGCNSSNFTLDNGASLPPLIVYLPNSPYTFDSNLSTFNPVLNNSVRDAVIQNGFNVATMGNGTRDSQWPTCVGCAILSRSAERTGTQLPPACQSCFERYCWNGTVNSTEPAPYNPTFVLDATKLSGATQFSASIVAIGATILTGLTLAM
ncbi:MAG: Lysophospholipase 1 [Bathelium mastoideum]|nr:MAG: Lysophospholipase 1 [Bathelium mastoideum]